MTRCAREFVARLAWRSGGFPGACIQRNWPGGLAKPAGKSSATLYEGTLRAGVRPKEAAAICRRIGQGQGDGREHQTRIRAWPFGWLASAARGPVVLRCSWRWVLLKRQNGRRSRGRTGTMEPCTPTPSSTWFEPDSRRPPPPPPGRHRTGKVTQVQAHRQKNPGTASATGKINVDRREARSSSGLCDIHLRGPGQALVAGQFRSVATGIWNRANNEGRQNQSGSGTPIITDQKAYRFQSNWHCRFEGRPKGRWRGGGGGGGLLENRP